MTHWVMFDEALGVGVQIAVEVNGKLHEESTGHQSLVIYETKRFGRALSLDGVIQITEGDEFVYSEMMAHVPILAHGAARHVMVVGGGDGGVLEEVLKHRSVERATLVEIDPHVVDLARTHMPSICKGAFDDPRSELVFADGARFVAETDLRPQVIIVDSTDPLGPGEVLFSEAFYADCHRCLAPGGVLVTQSGVPMIQAGELANTYRRLSKEFADAGCYVGAVPLYAGGLMAFGWASDDPAKRQVAQDVIQDRFDTAAIDTGYYSPAVHRAAFALPPYVARLLD